ncbi:MAG: hypothetical protein ABSE73_19480 [Planctomycetota bacterium]
MKTKPFEDENLARCLAARRSLERKFKTPEGLSDYLFWLEKQPLPPPNATLKQIRAWVRPPQEIKAQKGGVRSAKAQTAKKAPPAVRNGKAGPRKPVHKV